MVTFSPLIFITSQTSSERALYAGMGCRASSQIKQRIGAKSPGLKSQYRRQGKDYATTIIEDMLYNYISLKN